MKRLDKFSILIENEEMGREVKRIADKEGINVKGNLFCHNKFYYKYYKDNFEIGGYNITSDDYPLITFDQFKEMFEGEIIGYRCLKMVYGDKTTVGMLFIKERTAIQETNYYRPLDRHSQHIPKEFIENSSEYFNPVYKQTSKTVMVGGKEWKVSKEGVALGDETPNKIDEVEKISRSGLQYYFGADATLGEIKNLVDTYKEINK
jgi:hypothetical protein